MARLQFCWRKKFTVLIFSQFDWEILSQQVYTALTTQTFKKAFLRVLLLFSKQLFPEKTPNSPKLLKLPPLSLKIWIPRSILLPPSKSKQFLLTPSPPLSPSLSLHNKNLRRRGRPRISNNTYFMVTARALNDERLTQCVQGAGVLRSFFLIFRDSPL